jgi:hypothetical protein
MGSGIYERPGEVQTGGTWQVAVLATKAWSDHRPETVLRGRGRRHVNDRPLDRSVRVGPVGLAPSPLQMFVAFAPIATALLDPFQAAIGVGCFVGFVLIGTSFEARLVGFLVGIGR